MGRAAELTRRRADPLPLALLAALVAAPLLGGCAVFGGSGTDAGTSESPVAAPNDELNGDERAAADAEPPAGPPNGSMDERLLAGDYEGVLAAYVADTTLQADEHATYHAAIAAATAGHDAHDPRRAAALFARLLERHPDTEHRLEAELFVDLFSRQRDLRAAIDRLDRELQQLKAIDLGQEPGDEP